MSENKVVIERVFNAPLEKVWKAWTEAEQVKKWWGPTGFSAPTAEIDFKEGGKYLFCMRGKVSPEGPEADFWSTGTYKEIVPMKKIVCTDSFADEHGNIVSASHYGMSAEIPLELTVTIEFEEVEPSKTKMILTHVGMVPAEADNMTEGWNQSFDKLTQSVE